jgi:hypothetical protein
MIAIFVGMLFMALGIWGIVTWWGDFLVLLRGALPLLIAVGGLISVVAGVASIKDSLNVRPTPAKANGGSDAK